MQLPPVVSCIHPMALAGAVALLIAAGLHAALLRLRRRPARWHVLLAYPTLMLVSIWLGWYPASPLGFSTGAIPLLQGYRILRPQRDAQLLKPRQVVLAATGMTIGIEPVLLPGPVRCTWSSTTGADIDDPTGCNIAYVSTSGASYDFLKVHITPACGIPSMTGQLHISILP